MAQSSFAVALLYLGNTAGMGPKKTMKAMKKVGVKTVKKALEKAKPKRKALGKAKVKGKVSPKNSINKTNLEKLGRMSLDDKVKAAAESGDNLEEQAAVLKSSLEKDEHSQIWGRYQTYNKNNPEEKGRVDTLSKKKKGMKAAEWLMEAAGKGTCMSARVSQPLSLGKRATSGKVKSKCWTSLIGKNFRVTAIVEGLCTDRTLIPPMSGNTKTLRTGLVMSLLEG